ncbi:MAG: sortase, partial [Actinomycetota bacterium]|nr:sortase [Actinomycetota bacterium]
MNEHGIACQTRAGTALVGAVKLLAAVMLAVVAVALTAGRADAQESTVTVESGDTLSGIAEEIFGDAGQWGALFEANQDQIANPDLIFPEQVLRVSPEETPAAPAAAPEPTQNEEAAAETEAATDTTQADAYQYEQPASTDAQEEQAPEGAASGDPLPEPQEEEVAPQELAAPSGTAMSLSVPALGVSDIPVIDENSEAALTAGAMHLPGTGFPWQAGSNTYIAGHRIGYPGTPSDRVFYDLPSLSEGDEVVLTDADGRDHTYAVSEIFAVSPSDTYVTDPIAGRDVVTLQTCTETVDDWTTIGPGVMSSGPGSGRLIV